MSIWQAIATIIVAVAPLLVLALRAWLADWPARRARRARDENRRIDDAVRRGDVDAVNRWLRTWRAEDD